MIARLFGFDLAGRREPALARGVLFAVLASLVRLAPYLVLVSALRSISDGVATIPAVAVLLVLAAAFGVDWWLSARSLATSFVATYGLVADMRLAVADRLGRMPLGRVLERGGAALADLLTDRFSLYQSIATHLWWQVAVILPLPLMLWILLSVLDWRLGLLVALLAPLAALTIPLSFRALDAATRKVLPARDGAAERVVELVEGAKELRVLDPTGLRRKAAEEAIRELERRSLDTELAPAPAILAFGLTWSLALAIVMIVAAILWSSGRTEPAVLLASLIVATRLCAELADIGAFAVEARFARRIQATIRDLAEEPLQAPAATPLHPDGSRVEVDGVSFSYGGKAALRDVTLEVPPGTTTALVGHSGAGKSSLVSLVGRLWDVEAGAVRIGGVDVRDMTVSTLNETVGMVLQDVALFDLSIEDNIRLGRPDAASADVVAAARAACIHERILALPDGYGTILTGAGSELSGGERQRLAIARAILKDAPVMILDEATASVDLENEHLIRTALANLARGRTTIVISHRLRNVVDADQIAVMDGGRLVERGTFGDLRARDGAFERMWREQESAAGWRLDAG